jgi:SAM-dependent methyltransferase
MTLGSDRDWKKWGQTDPYFGVLTSPEFAAGRIADNKERFFATGRREVSATLAQVKRFYGDVGMSRALDFGSGVGRLVLPLARQFSTVVGVDISQDMLREASRNCADAGVTNVEFVISDDALSWVSGSFDLVHSYIVLQHIPVTRGLALTNRLLNLLKPGGVAVLHYSLQRTLRPIKAVAYAMKHSVPFGRIAMNLIQRKGWTAPAMQMNNYPLPDLLGAFERCGMEDLVIVPEWQESALTARVFARKGVSATTL